MERRSFKINGIEVLVSHDDVINAMKAVPPESVQSHGVWVGDQLYPVKQVIAQATGIDRLDFQSMTARSVLQRLGFKVVRAR
jgi:hypothetical protein